MADASGDVLLKTDTATVVLELLRDGKFRLKSSAWEDHRTALEGERVEVAVKNGRWVITKHAAPPPPPPKEEFYFSDED